MLGSPVGSLRPSASAAFYFKMWVDGRIAKRDGERFRARTPASDWTTTLEPPNRDAPQAARLMGRCTPTAPNC